MTRNRVTPDNAGQAIERGVERLKNFFAAEMRATRRTGRGPRPYRDHRGPAVRRLQSLPGLGAGRVDDTPLQPSRQTEHGS